MALPRFTPMVATTNLSALGRGSWAFEPKLDGWRALVYVDGGVTVRTRRGHDVTAKLPELAGLQDVLGGRSVVLDGELVAGAGLPGDFYRVLPAMARRARREALTFVAFDVLHLDGTTLAADPYSERRAALEGLGLTGRPWCTVSSFDDADPAEAFTACRRLGFEGIVGKRRSGRYRPGARSADWIKVKTPEWRELHSPMRHER